MAHPSPSTPAPVTPEAFLADRQRFLDGFWTAMSWALGVAVVVLILMAIFLV